LGDRGMRNVSRKSTTSRTARAQAILLIDRATADRIRRDELPKANPLLIAEIAGIQAAKNTPLLIPYCHSVPLTSVDVQAELRDGEILVIASVEAIDRTGVEMEALTAASVAALTLYDMLKIIDHSMRIVSVELLEKTGGKSDAQQGAKDYRAAVLVVSDSVVKGTRKDLTGPILQDRLMREGASEVLFAAVPDEVEPISATLRHWADEMEVALILTTGGTGCGPRDITPEAMDGVFDRDATGIAEAVRSYGVDRNRFAMLSRGRAGMRGSTIIVNLPGSVGAVEDGLDALFPMLSHAVQISEGGAH